jgi:acetylornithine deacetylase
LAVTLIKEPSFTGREGAIARNLAKWLESAGLEPELSVVTEAVRDSRPDFRDELDLSDRPNLYGWLRSNKKKSDNPLVLNGHLDVVPVGTVSGWRFPPFSAERAEGAIWGRGAADMKGPVAAGLMALRALKQCSAPLPFDVQIQLVIAEESGGLGTVFAIEEQPRPQAVIVMEPSECRIIAASGGSVQFTVKAQGKAAHGSTPWMGASALEALLACHARIERYARLRNERLSHPLLSGLKQCVPLNVGTFSAGEWRATVPESGHFSGRIGLLPGERLDEVRADLEREVEATAVGLGEKAAKLSISYPNAGFPAWETTVSSRLISSMKSAAAAVQMDPDPAGVTYGCDAGHFSRAGIPVAVFGPGGIDVAHMVDEHISEKSLLDAAKVLALSILHYGEGGASGQSEPHNAN